MSQGGGPYSCLHIIDQETEAQSSYMLPKMTLWGFEPTVWLQSVCFFTVSLNRLSVVPYTILARKYSTISIMFFLNWPVIQSISPILEDSFDQNSQQKG